MAAASAPSHRKQWIYTAASALVTAAVFSYLLQTVSFREVIRSIKEVSHIALFLFVVCSLAATFFRAWRYKLLLSVSGYRVNRIALFLVVVVRNLFADLLPARIGSLV